MVDLGVRRGDGAGRLGRVQQVPVGRARVAAAGVWVPPCQTSWLRTPRATFAPLAGRTRSRSSPGRDRPAARRLVRGERLARALRQAKRAVNQTFDVQGFYAAIQSVFDIHETGHGNALSISGYPVLTRLQEMKGHIKKQ